MKTKLVRPVLIASKEQTNLWSYKYRKLYYNQANFNDEDETTYYRVILISHDPNEKIEKGDLHIRFHNGKVGSNVDNSPIEWCHKYKYKKVIATQDQLSPELIQKLVDEYNNGEMQNFEIEMDCEFTSTNKGLDGFPEDNVDWWVYKPKLTNGFVTIVEKEHNIPYPEEPMEEDGELVYSDHADIKSYDHGFIEGYEARRSEETNLYTPQDLLEVMNLGMSLRQSQLNGGDSRSGNDVLYQWIQNKKK